MQCLPITEGYAKEEIFLPMYSVMTQEVQKQVINVTNKYEEDISNEYNTNIWCGQ